MPTPLELSLRRSVVVISLLIGAGSYSSNISAAELEVPLALDYRILQQAFTDQVFTGPDKTNELYADRIRCNRLVLSQPLVEGSTDGRVRFRTRFDAQTGTPVGDQCLLSKSWSGFIEAMQVAGVDATGSAVSFKIVDYNILRSDEQKRAIPRIIRHWIDQTIQSRLEAVKVDLQPVVAGIRELLDLAISGPDSAQSAVISSLRLSAVRPSAESLTAVLTLEVADAPSADTGQPEPVPESVLSEQELAEWDAAWQAWDGFATWLIKSLAITAQPELAEALAETLLEARYDLRDALAVDRRNRDQVRELFLTAWERLAPLVQELQLALPGAQALPYAGFISAGNALKTLDGLAPQLGLRLDRDSFRSMARLLAPGVSDAALSYTTELDPDLRILFGLDADFEQEEEMPTFLAWLIQSAHAVQISPALVNRLNGWVPKRKEIDQYLRSMEQLLDEIAQAERQKGKVPPEYIELYDALIRATAWQETCWRQYIEQGGTVQAIRSSAGSVGLMQINLHVWRGIYDVDSLVNHVGYNARAGNEILVHYLVDVAIRKKEQEISGEIDSLARATYAVYNGGPRHLSRYRNAGTKPALKQIDQAFWDKYRAIQQQGPAAVKQCYGG